LNDFDALGVADNLLLLNNSDRLFAKVAVVEVARAIKVVKVAHVAGSTVVVEGVESTTATDNQVSGGWEGRGGDTGRESGKSDNKSRSERSEHGDDLNVVERDKIRSLF